jgi:hypothetical protein
MHRREQRIQNTQSPPHPVQIFRDVTYLSGFYPTSFFSAESSTQNGGDCARQPSSIHCLRPPLLHRTVAYWTLRVTVAAWLVEPAEAVMVTVLVPPGALFPELEPPQPSR